MPDVPEHLYPGRGSARGNVVRSSDAQLLPDRRSVEVSGQVGIFERIVVPLVLRAANFWLVHAHAKQSVDNRKRNKKEFKKRMRGKKGGPGKKVLSCATSLPKARQMEYFYDAVFFFNT